MCADPDMSRAPNWVQQTPTGIKLVDPRVGLIDALDPRFHRGYMQAVKEIVAWLRTDDGPTVPEHDLADAISREFGGGS